LKLLVPKRPEGQLRPGFFDGRDDSPLGFHFIPTGEKSGVAAHGIEQEGSQSWIILLDFACQGCATKSVQASR